MCNRLNELVTLFTFNLICFCYPLFIQILEIMFNHQDSTKIKNVYLSYTYTSYISCLTVRHNATDCIRKIFTKADW